MRLHDVRLELLPRDRERRPGDALLVGRQRGRRPIEQAEGDLPFVASLSHGSPAVLVVVLVLVDVRRQRVERRVRRVVRHVEQERFVGRRKLLDELDGPVAKGIGHVEIRRNGAHRAPVLHETEGVEVIDGSADGSEMMLEASTHRIRFDVRGER